MPITKLYHRIWRPQLKGELAEYLNDELFANQKEIHSLISGARLILIDLHTLFEYIEPCDDNLQVYSHRIYELFLRASTEFEANCKSILKDNHFHLYKENIEEYSKLNQATTLNEYKISFNEWEGKRFWQPFKDWSLGYSLPWYQAYNHVKHDRLNNFKEANLENLMCAISGLLCIITAQVHNCVGSTTMDGMSFVDDKPQEFSTTSFTIQLPSFSSEESYDFIWKELKEDPDPVVDFHFV